MKFLSLSLCCLIPLSSFGGITIFNSTHNEVKIDYCWYYCGQKQCEKTSLAPYQKIERKEIYVDNIIPNYVQYNLTKFSCNNRIISKSDYILIYSNTPDVFDCITLLDPPIYN